MKKYDNIVVGSGVSGLTAALLLALHGGKVLLVEKAPRIGGSLCRFRRQGVPFDTGFHFTGGLHPGGLLHRMLSVLGLTEAVQPVFMSSRRTHHFVFESENRAFEMPSGLQELRRALKAEFPGESAAVDSYFDRVVRVCEKTSSMDLARMGEPFQRLDEETISLKDALDRLTGNALLKGVLCALGMCYGVKPSEVSFASHCRVCYDIYESTARFQNGGDGLIEAFEQAFRALAVDVCCGTWIAECRDVTEDRVGSFVLNTGEEVAAESAVLTIHPRSILELLPRDHLSRAFVSRVESFEPSAGFFTVYGTLDGKSDPEFGSTITSLFPITDFEQMLDPAYHGEPALVVCGCRETVRGEPCQVVTTFEPSFPSDVEAWKDTVTGHRPPAYHAGRVEAIRQHLGRFDRRYRDHLRVLDSASMLTFRDYLNSPDGAAYGIKQKVGQYNLIGKLPVHNLYAAGQSAVLPGVTGAMMSSFIVIRSVLGKEAFGHFVSKRL